MSAGGIKHSIGRPRCRRRLPFATLDFLAAAKPRGPPASVVLTDWVSTTIAVGAASRAPIARTQTIRIHNQQSRQA
jgi:hypothetical protein